MRVHAKSLRSRQPATPWNAAHQAPLSTGFFRQECWNGLPFSSPGDLTDPGIKPGSPASQAGSLLSELPGKPMILCTVSFFFFRFYFIFLLYNIVLVLPYINMNLPRVLNAPDLMANQEGNMKVRWLPDSRLAGSCVFLSVPPHPECLINFQLVAIL